MSSEPTVETLVSTGRKHYSAKAYEKAIEDWKKALEIYKREGKKREAGIVSVEIGRALKALGQNKEALVSCTQAVRLLREVNDPAVFREALLTMSRLMENLGYQEEAAQAYNQALDISISGEDLRTRIPLLHEVGMSLARVGKYRESALRFAEAVQLAEKIKDIELYGEALAGYARILQALHEHKKAEATLSKLIQLWDNAGRSDLSAHAYLGLASTYLSEEYLDKAEAVLQQAKAIFSTTSDKMGLALCDYHLARVLLENAELEAALPLAEAALQVFQNQRNALAYAESALGAAQILERLVQDVRALRLFDKAIEIFNQLNEKAREQQAHVLKGKAFLRMQKRKQAEQEFTQAIRYYQKYKRVDQEAFIYLQVGELLDELGQFTEALEQSKNALELLQNLNEEGLEVRGYRLFLKTAKKGQKINEELPFLQGALKTAQKQGKSLLASTLEVNLAQLSLDTQPMEQVRSVLEKAIRNEQLPMELRTEAALNLAAVLAKNNHHSEAAQYLSQAIKDFGDNPHFDKTGTYHQLAKIYHHLKKPALQKEALLGALQTLDPHNDQMLKGRIFLELAPLLERENTTQALEYYNAAAEIFSTQESQEQLFLTLQHQTRLLAQTGDYTHALELITKALRIGEELDIPATGKIEDPLEWKHVLQLSKEAIDIAAHHYHKHADRTIINKIIDWSTPCKVMRLQPFIAETLGFERCTELAKLMKEDRMLLTKASELRRQLSQQSTEVINYEELQNRRTTIRTELNEVLDNININLNVIAAACQDPGKGRVPSGYKMLEKLTALMPSDRRWILINYDVLEQKDRIIITTLDHVGRHTLHILPIPPDLDSVVQRLQQVKAAQELPPIVDLRDMASFLYRSLIPSRLERELQTHTYGFLQFVTDGFLNNVPFEVMYDGREYWGLKHPMAWVPDFQFFESTLKTKALAQSGSPTILLGVNSSSEGQSARRAKAEEIAKMFLAAVPNQQAVSEPIVLFGREFTRAQLARNIDQPRALVYFATPTSLHHRKGEILLQHPDSLRAVEIGVTTNFKGAPILVLGESTRLEPRGDGLSYIGFLRHLVAAGSPSIVFTRWTPEPQLQPIFTQALLKQLFEGDPIAVALFNTRRKLASKGPSPHSWLAYSLCGNPFPHIV